MPNEGKDVRRDRWSPPDFHEILERMHKKEMRSWRQPKSGDVNSMGGARFNFARGQAYHWSDDLSDPLDREQYHFDEVIFETIPTARAECANIIRPILDQMANAGGKATSPIFDVQGHYVPLKTQ
jgi:hypothetical protein